MCTLGRDTGSIFFLLRITLVGLFEYQALNSELNGFCSVKNGQVEAEISQCKVHRGCSIFLPNLRTKYGTLAHAQMLILVKKKKKKKGWHLELECLVNG